MKLDFDEHLTALVSTLRLLSLEASNQIVTLPEFVCVPDDLATSFDDLLHMYPEPYFRKNVSEEFSNIMRLLAATFADIQNHGDAVWTEEALRTNSKWQQVRIQASAALEELNRVYEFSDDIKPN